MFALATLKAGGYLGMCFAHLFFWLLAMSPVYALRLVNLKAARRIESGAYGWMAHLLMYGVESGGRLRFRVTGSALNGSDPARGGDSRVLLVSNHTSDADPFFVLLWAMRQGSSHGLIRFFMKRVLRLVFPAGPIMYAHDNIFLSRSYEADAPLISQQLQSLVDTQTPLWLVIFPEGSYVTPKRMELVEANRAFAREQKLPVLHNLLTPRTKGMALSLGKLKAHLDAVYDVTIAFGPPFGVEAGARQPPTIIGALGGALHTLNPPLSPADPPVSPNGPFTCHMHVTRIPASALPETPDDVSAWTHRLFAEKDALLSRFRADGVFPGTPHPEVRVNWRVKLLQTGLPPFATAVLVVWFIVRRYGGVWAAMPLFAKIGAGYLAAVSLITVFLARQGHKKAVAPAHTTARPAATAPAAAAPGAGAGAAARTKQA